MPSFADLLENRATVLADGAIGTNFQNMGIEPGVAPEEWVTDAPERVRELHRLMAAAGADLVLTCSFGGSPIRLRTARSPGGPTSSTSAQPSWPGRPSATTPWWPDRSDRPVSCPTRSAC